MITLITIIIVASGIGAFIYFKTKKSAPVFKEPVIDEKDIPGCAGGKCVDTISK
jgi:hypothetical protein